MADTPTPFGLTFAPAGLPAGPQAPTVGLRALALLLAVAGAVAFSGQAIIVKLAYRHGVDAVTLNALRSGVALPFFLALAWWAGRGKPALAAPDRRTAALPGFLGLQPAIELIGPAGPARTASKASKASKASTASKARPASTAQYGLVGPVSTIALGVLIPGEPFTAWVAAGSLAVLAGAMLLAAAR